MCLDISFKIDKVEDSIFDYLPHLKVDPQLNLHFDINSHLQAHDRPKTKIIFTNDDGDPYLTFMRWGILMKFMFKDAASFAKFSNNSYNARAEKIFDKSGIWYKIKKQRCLIDTPGIYEHRSVPGWKHKVPYFITLANNKRMLIPGFYYYLDLSANDIERIKVINDKHMIGALNKIFNFETGEITGTFVMITRAANEIMRFIHNDGPNKHRMPLFMQPEEAVKWIDPGLTDEDIKQFIGYEIPSADLKATSVYTIRTPKPRPDGKLKHEAFNWPGLPLLGQDGMIPNELF